MKLNYKKLKTMNQADIFSVWKKSNEESYNQIDLTPEKIREIIKPRVNRSLLPVKINMVTYLTLQFASIILLSYNLSLFGENTTLFILTTGMLAVVTFFFFYGLYTLYRINRTRFVFNDLMEAIHSRLKLLSFDLEIWLWFCSASLIILILALNMMTDSVDGHYRINNVILFTGIISIIFFFIYALNKLSLYKVISDYKDYYSDLQNNALDRLAASDRWMRKYRVWILLVMAVLFILLILAFIKGISMAHHQSINHGAEVLKTARVLLATL